MCAIHLPLVAVLIASLVSNASSDVQLKPTKVILVKNPTTGVLSAHQRKIVWKVKELASANTVTGSPLTSGATLRVAREPFSNSQCFDLPAVNWSAISTIGFLYKDADLSEGPVKVALIKKAPTGVFVIKVVLSSKRRVIEVTPGSPTLSYSVNLKMGGGDEYCSGSGTATPLRNDARVFKVVNDSTPASCGVSACSPSGAFVDG